MTAQEGLGLFLPSLVRAREAVTAREKSRSAPGAPAAPVVSASLARSPHSPCGAPVPDQAPTPRSTAPACPSARARHPIRTRPVPVPLRPDAPGPRLYRLASLNLSGGGGGGARFHAALARVDVRPSLTPPAPGGAPTPTHKAVPLTGPHALPLSLTRRQGNPTPNAQQSRPGIPPRAVAARANANRKLKQGKRANHRGKKEKGGGARV